MKNFSKILYRLLLLASLFTACGKADEKPPDAPAAEEADYIYVSKEISAPAGSYSNSFQTDGGYLYYSMYSALYRIPLDGEISFDNRQLVSTVSGDALLTGYTLDDGGDIYLLVQNISYGTDYSAVYRGGTLIRQTETGDKIYELALPDIHTPANSSRCLAAGKEGQVFLLAEDGIHVFDAEGNFLTRISTDGCKPQDQGGNENLLTGEAGRIYYLVCNDYSSPSAIYEITGSGTPQLTRRDEILNDIDDLRFTFFSSSGGLLCGREDGSLYEYSESDTVWHQVLRWQDSSLSMDVSEVTRLTPDTLLVYYTSYETTGIESSTFLLTKTRMSETPQKETLVLATTDSWLSLQSSVAAFNRASDRYHIEIKLYEGEAGLMRLDGDLVSDSPPDLLDMYGLSVSKYAQKQMLMDLAPYLDGSSVISREDFLENVLDGYTIDGKLCCIPDTFQIGIVIGRTSQVGENAGWTMEDLMDLTAQYPDIRVFDRNNFEYALRYFCSGYILEHFIDWENGICSFDDPEFAELINWIREHTKNIYLGFEEGVDYDSGVVPEDLLLLREWILYPRRFAQFSYYWDQPITVVGYPTTDGSPGYTVSTNEAVCIVSGCKNPDGAWQFLEHLLSGNEYDDPYDSFSSRKDLLYRSIEEEAVPQYEMDSNGEPIIVEHFSMLTNGEWVDHRNEPMPLPRSYLTVDGQQITYYYMEREQADALLEIIKNLDFTPETDLQNEIIDIIMEEITPCLTGDKTIETAALIIQNRIQTLIQENL